MDQAVAAFEAHVDAVALADVDAVAPADVTGALPFGAAFMHQVKRQQKKKKSLSRKMPSIFAFCNKSAASPKSFRKMSTTQGHRPTLDTYEI